MSRALSQQSCKGRISSYTQRQPWLPEPTPSQKGEIYLGLGRKGLSAAHLYYSPHLEHRSRSTTSLGNIQRLLPRWGSDCEKSRPRTEAHVLLWVSWLLSPGLTLLSCEVRKTPPVPDSLCLFLPSLGLLLEARPVEVGVQSKPGLPGVGKTEWGWGILARTPTM